MLYTRLERQPEKPEKGSHWLRVLPVGLNSWRIWNKQTFTVQGDEVPVSSGPPLRPGSSCLRQPPADLTTVSFCTEQSSCIMLCSVHVCALATSMALQARSARCRVHESAPLAGLPGTGDRL